MKPTNTIALVTLSAILLSGSVAPVTAAPAKFCKTYANKSVNAYVKSKNFGCNYVGPEWHGWWEGHRAWCRATPKSFVRYAHKERAKKLSICIAQGEN